MMDGSKDKNAPQISEIGCKKSESVELKVKISSDLYRAYQRCSWIIINETGREQLDIMEEMVVDFLLKYEC